MHRLSDDASGVNHPQVSEPIRGASSACELRFPVMNILDDLTPTAEQMRRDVSASTDSLHKAKLGQFLTPASVARFMAGLFPTTGGDCALLDAGAGIGGLTTAFLDRVVSGSLLFESVHATAYEVDPRLIDRLRGVLASHDRPGLTATVISADFLMAAAGVIRDHGRPYTHAILNPPYKKINNASEARFWMRRCGLETVNLYAGFVAAALAMLRPGGHLVAIIPRSFANGPYYRPFRDFLLDRAALRRIHLFESRNKAFADDDVLQENVILHLERDGRQGDVVISTSTDDTFADLVLTTHAFDAIVNPNDAERFIHIPTSSAPSPLDGTAARYGLSDLGIKVSTGPVVDFRLRNHLLDDPAAGAVPLLYPVHFAGGALVWPVDGKKPNAISVNDETRRWLYPCGHYCIVRRFSSKEERRRIVAHVIDPEAIGRPPLMGLENHINVFHAGRAGLTPELAHGMAAYLNTTAVDEAFRRFNGHTQVNATDLKNMLYPSVRQLEDLGRWAIATGHADQAALDARFAAL
jgi:adenine-specific DNA-methyltransferase